MAFDPFSSEPDTSNPMGSTDSMMGMGAPDIVVPKYNERHLLDIFEKKKKECFEYRWVWEREWLRDIYYTIGRQWITYNPSRREWVDKRLQKNVPRPTTPKVSEVLQSLRSSFGAVELGVTTRPIGYNPESIAAAEIAGQIAPLIHEEHKMDFVMREADFWFIVTGNAAIQISWDTDKRFNRVFIPHEQCLQCGTVLPPVAIAQNNQMCPVCQGNQFMPAMRPDGQPEGEWTAYGRGKTSSLSPFEYAFPPSVTRFDEVPYIFRLRWRDKNYYEANRPDLVSKITWEHSPQDRTLQIFKSLALTNDIGSGSQLSALTSSGIHSMEGVTEYELWIKPTTEFPQGFVMRVIGDRSPILLTLQDEGVPGPFPYKDIEGNPLFPFAHAQFEHVGGRLYGRSAISPIIQKQDQINQLDSLTQMIVQRMANPVWIVPEGAGLDHFTGDPGLVMKWNPLAAGGQAKPERIAGENIPPTLFRLREQYLKDLEDIAGTYDILKGTRPAGVEAFSALQLLDERSRARFTSAYRARGDMYRYWFSVAIELERQFGPQQRVQAIVGPNKTYTFQQFQNAQLQGSISVHVEKADQAQNTALAKRAAIEHANQLRLIDPTDPDQRYIILSELGLAKLVPSLDVHVQTALQMQDAFERWVENPMGPHPLVVKAWHDPQIHWNERIKWLNTDRMRELMVKLPEIEQVVTFHLQELQMALAPPPQVDAEGNPVQPEGGVGAGRAMGNSNTNAGSPTLSPAPQPNLQTPNPPR